MYINDINKLNWGIGMKKLVRIIFISMMIASLSIEVFADEVFLQSDNADGIISIEAEKYSALTAESDGTTWEVVDSTNASGGSALVIADQNDSRVNAQEGARLDYLISFRATGTHYIKVRGYAEDFTDDSFWIGIDGENASQFNTAKGWDWSDNNSFSIVVNEPGLHVLNIYRREDGYILDKIVLTTNGNYDISGLGPVESDIVQFNFPPVIASFQPTYTALKGSGQHTITLTGIADGDTDLDQNLSASVTTDNPAVVANLSVGNIDPEGAVNIAFTAGDADSAIIKIVIKDDGGTAYHASDSLEFSIQVLVLDPFYVGYSDEFDNELKASASTDFDLSIENGILHIRMQTQAKWQGIYYTIGRTVNIAPQPIMNLKVVTDVPFVLSAYIVDADDKNMLKQAKVYETDGFVNYMFDFSDYVSHGVDATRITNLIFTPNGASRGLTAENIFFDDLKLGYEATRFASIGGVKAQSFFENSEQQKIQILDISNATEITLSGGDRLLENIVASDINNGLADITFDCQPNKTGRDSILITAVGEDEFENNTIQLPVFIESNLPPTIDFIDHLDTQVGVVKQVILNGISDGNATIEQALTITAHSSEVSIIPDSSIHIFYEAGSPKAQLDFEAIEAGENIEMTVIVDDNGVDNNTTTTSFMVDAFSTYNHAPVVDPVANQDAILNSGEQMVHITGIDDGDNGSQSLEIGVTSSDESVLPDDSLRLEYVAGESVALLRYNPLSTGRTEIIVTITDDGGTAENNGDQQVSVRFYIDVRQLPPEGLDILFTDYEADKGPVWSAESEGTTMFSSYEQTDDGIALKFLCDEKYIWNGIWCGFSPINLTHHPYFSMEVKVEDPMYFWMWFWDADTAYTGTNVGKRNTNFNIPDKAIQVHPGEWTLITFDFSDIGLADGQGTPLLTDQIIAVLINFHHVFYSNEGTPNYNGNVWFRNLKVGNSAEGVVSKQPVCTIDAVPDQVIFEGASVQELVLSGITDGGSGDIKPLVTAISNNSSFIPNPTISEVAPECTAVLTYTPGEGIGETVITMTVSAAGSKDFLSSFKIKVIEEDQTNAIPVTIIRDSLYQTIRGFGTFNVPEQYVDLYTNDLGASAMRVGLISNQIEPVNDNNDPDVLDLSAFDYSAFDWDKLKRIKEAGVETFILTSWSPPAWMKRNLSVDYFMAQAIAWELTDNILEPYFYDEFAESMVAAVKMFKNEAGIDLTAIGPQNEPAFNEPYPSAVLGPQQFPEVIKKVGKRFEAAGINTKLYMPEQVFTQVHYSMDMYMDALHSDTEADMYTDIIATHSYQADGIGEAQPEYAGWKHMWYKAQEGNNPKELWMSETYPEYENWGSALSLAGAIHGALTAGNISLWTLWDIEGTLISSGKPTGSFYTSKNFYKFIRPGASRIKVIEDHDDILASSFIDQENNSLTTVLINKGPEPVTITLAGSAVPLEYDIYLTAEYINFEFQGRRAVSQLIILPPGSVTTCVGSLEEVTQISHDDASVPEDFYLYQNYPNPFNPQTTIRFNLARPVQARIIVYNVLGQRVKTLADKMFNAGIHNIVWEGRSDFGHQVSSGLYFYKIEAGNYVQTRKCLLLR